MQYRAQQLYYAPEPENARQELMDLFLAASAAPQL